MPTPIDTDLYEKAKKTVYAQFDKPSAYRSMALQKEYKRLGGRYRGNRETGLLTRWQREKWQDIGDLDYPVFRPTVKVSEKTPLTPNEIDKHNLAKQIMEKQRIRGAQNLKPFQKKR